MNKIIEIISLAVSLAALAVKWLFKRKQQPPTTELPPQETKQQLNIQ